MGRLKILVGILLVFLIYYFSETSFKVTYPISMAETMNGLKRNFYIAQKFYSYNENNPSHEYTDDFSKLSYYLKDIDSLKNDYDMFLIRLSPDRKNYTVTVKARDICKTAFIFTPDTLKKISELPDCAEILKKRESIMNFQNKVKFILQLIPLPLFILFSIGLFRNANSGIQVILVLIFGFFLYILMLIITPHYRSYIT